MLLHCKVRLPDLVNGGDFICELIGCFNRHVIWCRDLISFLQNAISRGSRGKIPLLTSLFDSQFTRAQCLVLQLQRKRDDIVTTSVRDAVLDGFGVRKLVSQLVETAFEI